MKKILLIVTVLIIALVAAFIYYLNLEYPERPIAVSQVNEINKIMNNILYDDEIYNNIENDFTISSLPEYSDDSEIIDKIKSMMSEAISEDESEKSRRNYINTDKCEYYIEIKNKKIQKIICSRLRCFTDVAQLSENGVQYINDENTIHSFSKFVKEIHNNFENDNN